MARKTKKQVDEEIGLNENEIIIGVTRIKDENKNKNKKKVKNNKNKKTKVRKNNKKSSKTKVKIRIVKYSAILISFIILILCTMFSPLFNIKNITVNGNEKISTEEIISLSQIVLEENTYKLNKAKIIKNIKGNAYIEDVKIKRILPNNIEINIKERSTSFMLEYANGFVYLNNQGYILEISSQKVNVPIIQGQATEDSEYIVGNRLNVEDLQKLSTVLKIIEQAQINQIYNLITKIDINNKNNFIIIMEDEGKTAHLGDCSNLSTRMLNVKKILEKEKGIEGEIFVDMDLNNSYPVFRQKV